MERDSSISNMWLPTLDIDSQTADVVTEKKGREMAQGLSWPGPGSDTFHWLELGLMATEAVKKIGNVGVVCQTGEEMEMVNS